VLANFDRLREYGAGTIEAAAQEAGSMTSTTSLPA